VRSSAFGFEAGPHTTQVLSFPRSSYAISFPGIRALAVGRGGRFGVASEGAEGEQPCSA
jgi:hypothetical protein